MTSITMSLTRRDQFSSIWLKGVRAVDLDQHCLPSLIGNRYAMPQLKGARFESITLELALAPGELALYLCGVTAPYRWEDNAHLAIVPSPGAKWHGPASVPGLTVTLIDAEPIFGWGEHDVDREHKNYPDRLWRTCRNLQFASWAATNLGAPVERNGEGDFFKQAAGKSRRRGQGSLF